MVCADPEIVGHEALQELAAQVARAQLSTLEQAVKQVTGASGVRPQAAFISGAGEFLARELARRAGIAKIISCAESAGRDASEAACAHALAELAASLT